MNALELKVPPPIVALVMAIAMGFLSRLPPLPSSLPIARLLAVVGFAAVGAAFGLAAVIAFRRARTTVNPLKPESTSALVGGGVYKLTRNPMYVGMLFLLGAWAAFLWSAWSLLGLVGFAMWIDRFQIVPEERTLSRLFGADFAAYEASVRRWL